MSGQATPLFVDQPIRFGRKNIRGRFVIPSGIRCTRGGTIGWCFEEVEAVGVVTTKSISPAPRAVYVEPIYARYAPDSYINAVGLANPGAEKFLQELRQVQVPADKLLLVSIFGGNLKEFVDTARVLQPVADGFELNMSCPHAQGYGVEIGQNRELVAEITAAIVAATGLPVIVKLSGIVGDVGQTAKAAIAAGAAGITVTNTIGPATVNLGETPILSNRVGGLSGAGIRPLALRAVKCVRDAIGQGPILIAMGGIATAEHVREFRAAGADFLGMGSALTGMNSSRMRTYFDALTKALREPRCVSIPEALPEITMEYTEARVAGRENYHKDLFKLVLDRLPIAGQEGELAGKYFFLFLPGVGEKPFAVFSAAERSIVVKTVGRFTRRLAELAEGSSVFLRGPYGQQFPSLANRTVVFVGGGTGIASLLEIGLHLKDRNELHFLFGGRSGPDLFGVPQFSALGTVALATNDGSRGHRGFVSELLVEWLEQRPPASRANATYVMCGPEPMVEACFNLLQPVAEPQDIWGAIEYMTSCGVGICGKCASPSGMLTCIDGPFMPLNGFRRRGTCAVTEAMAGAVPVRG